MKRSTLISLAVFGVLALAWVGTRERHVQVGVHKLELAPVSADAIVEVALGGVMMKAGTDGGWTVEGSGAANSGAAPDGHAYAADRSQVHSLLMALEEVKAPDFVTERPERHAELEVDDAKGVKVTARSSAGVVRELVLGKTSKSGGVYLRRAGSNEVFSVAGPIGYQARRPLKDWREKRIPTAPVSEVTGVQVTPASGAGFTLARDGEAWKLESPAPSGFRFDAAAAQRLVTQLTSLTAQDFSEGGSDELTEPAVLVMGLKGGGARTVRCGAKRADGLSALRVDGEAQTWLVPAWVAEPLLKDLEGLRDTQVLRFEPAKVERLTLSAGAKKAVAKRDGTTWKLVEPKTPPAGLEFDPGQVEAVLGRLAAVRGTRVAEVAQAKAGLGAPAVELAVKDGAPVTLRFGGQAGAATELFARGSDDLVFVVPAAQKTWLEGGVEVFRKPPPQPQFNGVQGLEQLPPDIRAKLEAQLGQQQVR